MFKIKKLQAFCNSSQSLLRISNCSKIIWLLVLGVGISLLGFGQDEILLYENDFETFNIEPSNTFICSNGVPFDDLDRTTVNELWGGTGSGTGGNVFFNQTFTVETILINGEDNRYTDPDGKGGNYCIGMLTNSGNDDMLSLTLNTQTLTFLNISFSLSAIDLGGCNSFGVNVPIMKIRIYDTPNGIFDFSNKGTELGEATVEGIEPMADKYTFSWIETNTNLNIEESINGNISIVFDLIQSGYGALDNLRITATETCDTSEINLDSSLVAHYPFQGTAIDVSQSTNNGELFGATLTTDRFGNEGNAFHFDGSSYISIADNQSLQPRNFTISLWCKFENLNENVNILIDKHLTDNDADSYELWFENNTIYGQLSDLSGSGDTISHTFLPDENTWYHIVYSFSDENNIKSLYVNDTIVRIVNSLEENKTIAYSNSPVNIGAGYLSENERQYFFNGDIDDVRIYDRVLSSCEIEALFELPYISYTEDTAANCNDGIDNDGDGFKDCEDLDCIIDNLCESNTNNACPVDSFFKLRPGDGVFTCASERIDNNPVVAIKNIDEVLPNGLLPNRDLSGSITKGKVFTKNEIGGEVFGTCIDDAGNIYVSATTLYSYNRNNFSGKKQNGFASIVKISGDSLKIDTTFLAVLKQSAEISGFKNEIGEALYKNNSNETYSGLGNIAYDSNRDHLLVTNFEDGKIWRINTNGIVIDSFDPFMPDNGINGFAPLGERLWGIQTHALNDGSTEIYFGVWNTYRRAPSSNRNTLYKMKIDSQGNFTNNSLQFILEVPDLRNSNQPISDIAISKDGLRLILSCHTMFGDINLDSGTTADFAHHSSLYYIERNTIDSSIWSSPKRFNLSSNTTIGNSAGGVDFGPLQAVPNFDFGSICDQMIWASGDNLLGGVTTYGLQGFSISEVFNENAVDITQSYIIDGNGVLGNDKSYLGDIEIFTCNCFECDVRLDIESTNQENNCCFEADLLNLGVSTNVTRIEIAINSSEINFLNEVTVNDTSFIHSINNNVLAIESNPNSENYPLLPNLNSNNFINFCMANNGNPLDEYSFTARYFDETNEELSLCKQSLSVETNTCELTISNVGCTNPTACNYNPAATEDDGSCIPCYLDCDSNPIIDELPGTQCENENSNVLLSYIDFNCECIDVDIVVQCVVETPSAQTIAGEEYCFIVTVTDSLSNEILPNFPVNFFVEGANEGTFGVDTTDQFGQIDFCYPANSPGLDFITVNCGNFNLTFNALIFDFNFSPINLNFGPFTYTSSNGSLVNINNLQIDEEVCTTVVIEDNAGEIITGVEVIIVSVGENTGDTLVNVITTTNLNGEIKFCGTNSNVGVEQCILSIPSTEELMPIDTIINLNWIDLISEPVCLNDNLDTLNCPCNSVDYFALRALYLSTDGENWRRNDGWEQVKNYPPPTDCDLSDLYGVTLDNNGRVTEINLYNNDLNGTLTPEIGDLTELTALYLSSVNLDGEIPVEIAKLSKLEYLFFVASGISGAIPPELGELTNMKDLRLSYNSLTGEIPIELTTLPNLDYLNLRNNQLSGSIPPELVNLSNLRWLILSNNQLSGCYPSALSALCDQLIYNFFGEEDDIDSGNSLEAEWDDFCLAGEGDCNTLRLGDLNNFDLYPNPTTGNVIVQFENVTEQARFINIYNIAGKSEVSELVTSGKNKQLNLNHLSKGIYIVDVSNGFISKTQKLIIQ